MERKNPAGMTSSPAYFMARPFPLLTPQASNPVPGGHDSCDSMDARLPGLRPAYQ
jgi:hypothetical protein